MSHTERAEYLTDLINEQCQILANFCRASFPTPGNRRVAGPRRHGGSLVLSGWASAQDWSELLGRGDELMLMWRLTGLFRHATAFSTHTGHTGHPEKRAQYARYLPSMMTYPCQSVPTSVKKWRSTAASSGRA